MIRQCIAICGRPCLKLKLWCEMYKPWKVLCMSMTILILIAVMLWCTPYDANCLLYISWNKVEVCYARLNFMPYPNNSPSSVFHSGENLSQISGFILYFINVVNVIILLQPNGLCWVWLLMCLSFFIIIMVDWLLMSSNTIVNVIKNTPPPPPPPHTHTHTTHTLF